MTWQLWFVLSIAGLTLLVSAGAVWLTIRLCKGLLEAQQPVLLRQLELIDKMTTIAAAQDVAAYQAIQVMDQQRVGYPGEDYDPSDEAEARREAIREGLDPEELSDGDQEALRGLF